MFDSKQYAWANIKVFMFGRLVTGIRGIEYKVSKDKEPVYGAGDEPMSIQSGNKAYEGSIDLLQSELEAILVAAKAKGYADTTDIPGFTISITYGNKGQAVITDVLKGVEFTEEAKSMKQGDKFMEISMPVVFLRKENAA